MASRRVIAALATARATHGSISHTALRLQASFPPPHGARCLTTTTPMIDEASLPESLLQQINLSAKLASKTSFPPLNKTHERPRSKPFAAPQAASPRYDPTRAPSAPTSAVARAPLSLSSSLKSLLPHLAAQQPFYITAHIHGKPYLVTAGDTVRLPFLMHGVQPGDVLRLDRATLLGSRDWTLRGGASGSSEEITPSTNEPLIIGRTDGITPTPQGINESTTTTSRTGKPRRGPPAYVDDRLFECRATVLGTESEPLRIKEKTKQRQRRVKKVKSKHRYTILKISEIKVKNIEELESGMAAQNVQ